MAAALPPTTWIRAYDPANEYLGGYGLGQRAAEASASLIDQHNRAQAQLAMEQQKIDAEKQQAAAHMGMQQQLQQQNFLMEQQRLQQAKAYQDAMTGWRQHQLQQQSELKKMAIAVQMQKQQEAMAKTVQQNASVRDFQMSVAEFMDQGHKREQAILMAGAKHPDALMHTGLASVYNQAQRSIETEATRTAKLSPVQEARRTILINRVKEIDRALPVASPGMRQGLIDQRTEALQDLDKLESGGGSGAPSGGETVIENGKLVFKDASGLRAPQLNRETGAYDTFSPDILSRYPTSMGGMFSDIVPSMQWDPNAGKPPKEEEAQSYMLEGM